MQADRVHPVTYALTVARACADLAVEALNQLSFPAAYAATLSAAADDAASRLGAFLSTHGESMTSDFLKVAYLARTDLEAVAQITGLVKTNDLRPRAASFIARSTRHTADRAIIRLMHLEEMIDV